jgi:predicted flap endonuclease-1-like 5' DNA nuclease
MVSLLLSGFTSNFAQESSGGLGWIGVLIALLLLIPVVMWLTRSSGRTETDHRQAASESPAPAYPVTADELNPAPIDPAPVKVEDIADGTKEVIENVVDQIADTAADGADEVEAVVAPQPEKIEPNPSAEAGESRSPRAAQASTQPDDLTVIEGIGPKISGILQENGINTFADLAAADLNRLREILQKAELGNIANPATWVEQAQLAAEGRWDELKTLQSQLKGGRRA